MMRLLLFLLSFSLSAQQRTVELTPNNIITDCSSTKSLTATGLQAGQPVTGFVLKASDPSIIPNCQETPTPPDGDPYFKVPIVGADGTGQVSVKISDLLTKQNVCPPNRSTGTGYLCLYQDNKLNVKATFRYDTRLNKVNIQGISAGNQQIIFTIQDDKNLDDYIICYGEDKTAIEDKSEDCKGKADTFKTKEVKLTGLTNDRLYYFKAKAPGSISQSPWSPVFSETPIETFGFAGVYDGAENPLSFGGGCSQSSAKPGTWVLLAGLLLLLMQRRRSAYHLSTKWISNIAPGVSPGEGPTTTNFSTEGTTEIHTSADPSGLWGWMGPRSPGLTPGAIFTNPLRGKNSSSRFLFPILLILLIAPQASARVGQTSIGILGAPYLPNLDRSTKPDGSVIKTPFYARMFESRLTPLMGFEFDINIWEEFGTLQAGMGTSYTYAGGQALKKDLVARSADSVGLHMIHLRPQLTYLLDKWADEFPLVPYARVGIDTVGYLFQYQGGLDTEKKGPDGKDRSVNPMGFVFGWDAALGLMINMKMFEPSVADAAVGTGTYRRVYLKTEFAYMPINNFYSKGLDFSPAWISKDFPLMITFGIVFELP